MPSARVTTLLAWCAENRVQIDSRLQIIDSQQASSPRHEANSIASDEPSRERGLSVYSREELIECARTLVYIPKTAVLSVKSCFFSRHISSVPYGHGAHLSLALALYGELLLGPRSRWSSYLQSLPGETVDIALFWGVDDVVEIRTSTCSSRGCLNTDEKSSASDKRRRQVTLSQCPWCLWLHDNQNAREWLKVTEIDREQAGQMEEVRQYYHDVVEPTFHAASTNSRLEHNPLFYSGPDRPRDSSADIRPRVYGVTFPGFCLAYSLVSTRAFWVDAYHGLAMVPIADAVCKSDPPSSFNHTNDNHVQMESDYDVCVECGSLAECEHDHEVESTIVPASLLLNVHPLSHDGPSTFSEIDYLEMRTVRPIPPLSEVFNTYGSLSNATLLSRYGFVLPENDHDTVRMVLDPLSTMRSLFKYVGLEEAPVGEDNAGREASTFGRFAIRNACRVGDFTDHGGVNSEPHLR
ncbi:hypothetical protein HD554DRAFT_1511990 [Boletus coccyginus]|nr:hypothetical protein HD554DRAFT_1511990 [Boletus coccyginus]